MKVLRPAHQYELENFEAPQAAGQILQFIEKEPTGPGETTMRTIHDGTTNEEVLKVLIDRFTALQAKFPCKENAMVITKLEESLMWCEKRTRDRQARKVEGTAQK
jgi:hypothetical protein